jgi:hypothetical protein
MEPLSIPDDRRAAVLIAKFIRGKIKGKEEKELDRWIVSKEENYRLFNELITPAKKTSAAEWFSAHGVNPKFLNTHSFEGYGPKAEPFKTREFYIGAAIAVVAMAIYYLVIRLFQS